MCTEWSFSPLMVKESVVTWNCIHLMTEEGNHQPTQHFPSCLSASIKSLCGHPEQPIQSPHRPHNQETVPSTLYQKLLPVRRQMYPVHPTGQLLKLDLLSERQRIDTFELWYGEDS
ncbi:unnamed protein product [Rangifer tarandus platyrhynchus]|uniref:Uncharacterized protein n=2 Tax=Rangifer tarandus platyrhynchus TaxID=3082113 RepID=A0AC60A225_RANTA|nr:unnamed protein product [Rangifer tarandus platyrhynchus]